MRLHPTKEKTLFLHKPDMNVYLASGRRIQPKDVSFHVILTLVKTNIDMTHTTRTLDDENYFNAIVSLETGDTIPNIELMEREGVSFSQCFGVSLGVHNAKSIAACIKIMEQINFSGLDSFSETFQELVKPDELLLLVEGQYFINSNHPFCLSYSKDERLRTMNVFHSGPSII